MAGKTKKSDEDKRKEIVDKKEEEPNFVWTPDDDLETEELEAEETEEEEEFEDPGIKEFRVLEFGFMIPLTVNKIMEHIGVQRFDIPNPSGLNRVIIDTKPNIALVGDGRFYAQFDFFDNRLMAIMLIPAGASTPEEAKMYSEGILKEAFGDVKFMHEAFRWFVVEDHEKPFGSDSTGMIRIELYPELMKESKQSMQK